MKYAVVDKGVVENIIEADDGFYIDGKTLVKFNDQCEIGGTYTKSKGFVRKPIVEPELSYSEKRARKYPILGDQLDMLWHAMDNDTMVKSEPFYSTIKAIKTEFPKE